MLNPWIQYCDLEPDDREHVLAYTLIPHEQVNDPYSMQDKKRLLLHKGKYLSGPNVRIVCKDFIAKGGHNPIEYWQPIAGLPG